jgi:diguanylate cyclase
MVMDDTDSTEKPATAADIEAVVRPLLADLARDTGMQSVYLTGLDWTAARQSIMFAHNDGKAMITEGHSYPWSSALCRRALVDGPDYTVEAQEAWPDAVHARVLDLSTFISIPVLTADSPPELVGTLCAVSSDVVVLGSATRRKMRAAADLMGRQIAPQPRTPAGRAPAGPGNRAEIASMAEDLDRATRAATLPAG